MFQNRTDISEMGGVPAFSAGERRAERRRRVLKAARVVLPGRLSAFDVTVRDAGEAGARIRATGPVRIPEVFEIELQISEEKRPRKARLAWLSGAEAGLCFTA
jgi:hypothetical protein